MKYLDLGKNEKVSCIGIGCMRIAGMSSKEVDTLVKTALDEGINFFDIKRMFYRNQEKALAYLNGMNREQGYYNSDPSKKTVREGYTLDLTRALITVSASQMYLPMPGSELTAMPSLAEPAVDYYAK